MKMDLKTLCGLLARTSEEESVSSKDCNPYLLEKVLRPLIRDETVLVKDIDFGQFDADDIPTLVGYYESLEMQGRKLMELAGAVAAIEPVACKTRRFC